MQTILYGWAMSQKLPTKNFKWENDPDYYLTGKSLYNRMRS